MLEETFAFALVIGCSVFGILWGVINILLIKRVDMQEYQYIWKGEQDDHEASNKQTLINEGHHHEITEEKAKEQLNKILEISSIIQDGAITFLKQEYLWLTGFVVLFAILIAFVAEPVSGTFYTTIAFLIGAATSIASGYIGMRIATYTNARTTKECATSIHNGFVVAYRGGQVLGFILVGLALLVLQIIIIAYKEIYLTQFGDKLTFIEVRYMFEMISGYGLGGSTVALFGRVGGGIYTKAADVGSDLAGKVINDLKEDDPKNPGTIADNVGDNVGDIAGMGADLFGSLAESTCAALLVSANSTVLISTPNATYFPLLVTAVGILASFITTFFATHIGRVNRDNVESKVKWQLIISTILMTLAVYPLTLILPAEFTFTALNGTDVLAPTTPLKAFACVASGLWSGFIIGWITEIYTSNAYSPVQDLAEACVMGAAPNIILGLALGYMSTIIPIICICLTIYLSFTFASMYGIALAALGMLGCLPIALSIDGYGPISDNAGGIAEMSELHESVREKTDKLDAAGNTTAAIGKGFAIGSACLVSLALFGAFVTRAGVLTVDILQPLQFSFLLFGAMIPYAFSALTMAAVGQAATEMIVEIKRQFDNGLLSGDAKPEYGKCIQISTDASLKKMIAPGLLVIVTPLATGFIFGSDAVAGLLAGLIVSGVQIAISFSNTGGAWDNAKKYIESGKKSKRTFVQGSTTEYLTFVKGSDAHKSAVVGDTVGDPLKDTSGPSINILIKLSAITSLVFGGFFSTNSLLNRKVVLAH